MSEPKKTWAELRTAVGELRQQLSGLYSMTPSNITFRSLPNGRTRIYFLPNHMNGSEVPLLYTDISTSDNLSGGSCRRLTLHQLLESNFPAITSSSKLSREELLMRERKRRAPSWGISSYELHAGSGKLIFPAASNLFQCLDTGFSSSPLYPTEVRMNLLGAKLNPQICPSNADLVAFINNQDIYVTHTVTGHTKRLTFAHKNVGNTVDDPLSAGIPSYVIQEEFCRYQGFWWQSTSTGDIYRIAYEEVDESEVKIYGFPSYMHNNGEVEEFRYPRAGTSNAKSTLKLVEFKVSSSFQIIDVKELEMITPLSILFPWMEYLVRVGWTPESDFIWVQILDRKQQHLELVLISLFYFVEVSSPEGSPVFSPSSSPSILGPNSSNHLDYVKNKTMVLTLCSQESDLWINVNNLLYFFPKSNTNEVQFIFVNEDTGFRHLYLFTVPLAGVPNGVEEALETTSGQPPSSSRHIALTSGDWEVLGQQIWVDSENSLVYFLGLRENPLEKHLYAVSLKRPGEIRLLTQPGYSYNIDFSQDCKLLVMSYSNIQKPPVCEVLRVSHRGWSVDEIVLTTVGYIMEPRIVSEGEFYSPELYTHQIRDGTNLYAMVFKPHSLQSGQKYPTVLHIYGGPEVQVVSNTFKGMRHLRLHMLAAQGYCVVAIDSRGSRHRGLAFEGHIRCKMGTVELADQVEVLQWLADSLDFIDMKRVAVLGWSYGGYLSLMALAHYPDVFKVAIAGAPVTSWSHYDTGYTERYMDLPEHNQTGYKKGSVLSYVNQFPDEENRLLIIHGLIDENVHFLHTTQLINALVKAGKPYQLQVYPNERHSLRHMDASKHYETVLLSFLQNNL